MEPLQFLGLFVLISVAGIIFISFMKEFKLRKIFIFPLLVPLITFTLGFAMRLSQITWLVDLGFFYTDFSFIFIYTVFSSAFLLGQIKYWKKE